MTVSNLTAKSKPLFDTLNKLLLSAPMVKLGELIEEVNERNISGASFAIMGINKSKTFMPTVADTNNLDLSKYKIVRKGIFAFSGMQTGRDECIRIALSTTEKPFLISPAYTTFAIKKEFHILANFLMLLMLRHEADRLGAYYSDGSIRSNLDWERFCEILIPLPSLAVQRELVAVYEGLQKLIAENEALLPPLESACQAYMVDCMHKYPLKQLGEFIEECDERNRDNALTLEDVRGISNEKKFIPTKANMDNVSLTSYKVVKPQYFVYVTVTSRNGEKISLALYGEKKFAIVSSTYIVFRSRDTKVLLPGYLFLLFNRGEFDRYARFNSWGSARETFDFSEMCKVRIPLPPIEVQEAIVNVYNCLEEAKRIILESRELMNNLCPALVQKASHSI